MGSFKDVYASLTKLVKGIVNKASKNYDSDYRSYYCAICAEKNKQGADDSMGQNEARFVIIADSVSFHICARHHPNPKIGDLAHEIAAYFEKNELIWTDLYVMSRDSRIF